MKALFIYRFSHKLRIAIVAISVLCSFTCIAQSSIAEQLEYMIYEDQDFVRGQQLYNRITQDDIRVMPDSVLFNYHYLGGYINSEIPNHDKAIKHLLEAKTLCETHLGTHSTPYMEIMKGLGDEYVEIGEYEKALETYQEAIVKSMAVRNFAKQAFSNLIMGVKNGYERLGYYNEIPTHLLDAWSFWDKGSESFSTYSYYPLWELEQFYLRYELYDNALSISDLIVQFVKNKVGERHPELADVYYTRGNILLSNERKEEAVKIYRQGLQILQSNNIKDTEISLLLKGNLLTTLASLNEISECELLLKDIESYCLKIGDMTKYKNSLFTMANQLNAIGRYNEALEYNNRLLRLKLTSDEAAVVDRQYNEINYNKNVIDAYEELLSRYSILAKGSPEWFENAHLLSSAYHLKKDVNNNRIILEEMYATIQDNQESGYDYTLWVLNNLMLLNSEDGRPEEALVYAKKRKDFIESLVESTEADKIEAINQVIVMKLRGNILDQIDSDWAAIGDFYTVSYGELSDQNAIYLHNIGRTFQLQGKYEDAKMYLQKSVNIQNRLYGKPMGKTVKYLMEVEQQLSDDLI